MNLRDIVELNVFDTHPLMLSGGFSHASFDDFTGRQDVEHRLAQSIRGLRRCSVVAPPGWGKTNLAAHGLLQTDRVLPISVAVAYEDVAVLRDVGAFARHLLDAMVRAATGTGVLTDRTAKSHLGEAGGELVSSGGRSTRRQTGASIGWSSVSGDVRRELVEKSADVSIRTSVARTQEHVNGVLESLRDAGFLPTLYFDDTDRLLRTSSGPDPSVVNQFFGPLLRWLSELPCGVLCSAQPEYLRLDAYRNADEQGLLQERVDVPFLTSTQQLRQVLDVHVAANQLAVDEWAAALDEAAVVELFALYADGQAGGLRRPIRLIELAVRLAVESNSERITVPLIRDAEAELL